MTKLRRLPPRPKHLLIRGENKYMFNLTGDIVIYLISACAAAAVGVTFMLIYLHYRKNNDDAVYSKQLEDLLSDDNDVNIKNTSSISYKWNKYWGGIAKESGLSRYSDTTSNAGRDAVILTIVSTVLISALFQNIIAGAAISLALLFGASTALRTMSNKKVELLNNQLPGFLFALKANVVSGETLEKSFLKISNVMPQPLCDDLNIVTNRILANATFKEALEELSEKTTSNDLRFLCSCMIQASGEGISLETQINTIQEVIEEKQRVSREITKGLKSATPSIWVSSVAIPGSFIAAYLLDVQAREFWFNGIFSWILLIVVGVLWGLSIYGTKKMADGIRNL